MKTVLLDHGSGGLASSELIDQVFIKHLDNPILRSLEDSAILENQEGNIAFTTDSYVVDPLFFPGGDIGKLAVHGTINDLAISIPLQILNKYLTTKLSSTWPNP